MAYRAGAAVRLPDVANVEDSVEDLRVAGLVNGKPAVMVIIFRQPEANIIETVDRVRSLAPAVGGSHARGRQAFGRPGPDAPDSRFPARRRTDPRHLGAAS